MAEYFPSLDLRESGRSIGCPDAGAGRRAQLAPTDFVQALRTEAIVKAGRDPLHLALGDPELSAPTLIAAAGEGAPAVLADLRHRPPQNSTPR